MGLFFIVTYAVGIGPFHLTKFFLKISYQESFYKNNQKEIDQHIRARTLIEKISGKKNLRKKWMIQYSRLYKIEDEVRKYVDVLLWLISRV